MIYNFKFMIYDRLRLKDRFAERLSHPEYDKDRAIQKKSANLSVLFCQKPFGTLFVIHPVNQSTR